MSDSLSTTELIDAVALVSSHTELKPQVGVILGSGLGGFANELADPVAIPYCDIPGFPHTTVPGHSGELVLGTLEGVPLAAMKGRPHLYEGYTPTQVGFPVQLLHALGARTLIATNASGGLRTGMETGTFMVLDDHINLPGLVGLNPLLGPSGGQERFVSMAAAYDEELRLRALEAGRKAGLKVTSGVYVMVAGPSYETPAEARFLLEIGADAVGMSTVTEVVVARALGMRVLGVSCITNVLLGTPARWSEGHGSVVSVAESSADGLTAIIRGVLRSMQIIES
ncbi:MAG: purine-nucleoside phosphorylase [Chloroflexota bacterium]